MRGNRRLRAGLKATQIDDQAQARLAAVERELARLQYRHDIAMSAFLFEEATTLGRAIAALEQERPGRGAGAARRTPPRPGRGPVLSRCSPVRAGCGAGSYTSRSAPSLSSVRKVGSAIAISA